MKYFVCSHSMRRCNTFAKIQRENEHWDSVHVIIIDMDFTEFKVLKDEFPNAVILYCQWHVIKALFKCLSDCDVNKGDREECRQIIQSMIYSINQETYERWRQELLDLMNEEFKKHL